MQVGTHVWEKGDSAGVQTCLAHHFSAINIFLLLLPRFLGLLFRIFSQGLSEPFRFCRMTFQRLCLFMSHHPSVRVAVCLLLELHWLCVELQPSILLVSLRSASRSQTLAAYHLQQSFRRRYVVPWRLYPIPSSSAPQLQPWPVLCIHQLTHIIPRQLSTRPLLKASFSVL